jgi:hypothetical protein
MQETAPSSSFTNGLGQAQQRCPVCGCANTDWARYCVQCGRELPFPEAAQQAEAGHIEYLLIQIQGWVPRGLLSAIAESRLRREYTMRRSALIARLSQAQGAVVTPAANPDAVQSVVMERKVETLKAPETARTEEPQNVTSPATPRGLQVFLQEHALKILFALATVLTLVALRSMIAWEEVGQVVVRLIPAVPLGLTALFWVFGQKTRCENPWAAFVYHGLTAVLLGFDVIAVSKYWLFGMLTARPALLSACAAATALTGALLLRWRELPYFHLFHVGALTTLYTLLQALRIGAGPSDLAPAPVTLFGSAYLAYAGLCLLAAWQVHLVSEPDAQETSASSRTWTAAWLLWTHLSLTAAGTLAAWRFASEPHSDAFALLALFAGLIYLAGAQCLGDPRMLPASAGFLIGSGVLWLREHESVISWSLCTGVLLTLSATALALAFYNERRTQDRNCAVRLAQAYRELAQCGVVLATVLLWGRMLWALTEPHLPHATQIRGSSALLALFCGGLSLVLARCIQRREFVYNALTIWAAALLCGLAYLHAPTGLFPWALIAYGALLCTLAYLTVTRPQNMPHLAEWTTPFAVSGQAIATFGALWESCVLSPSTPFAVPAWSLFLLAWSALYLLLAYRWNATRWAFQALFPAVLGFVWYFSFDSTYWQTFKLLSAFDRYLTDGIWVIGFAMMAWAYIKIARQSECADFAYASAILLTGSYFYTWLAFCRPEASWHALILLPFLTVLYLAGTRVPATEEALLGVPLRRTALVISGAALLWSVGISDSLFWITHRLPPMPARATLTLTAYSVAYLLWVACRRSPASVTASALTLTAAYLHHLLTRTALFVAPPAPLSWPHAAFLAVQAGLFWMLVAGHVQRRLRLPALAAPLQAIAAGVALLSAVTALLTVQTPDEGRWSILTLGLAGGIWFGLWLLGQGELCLHVGTWNLLAAWGLTVYNQVGADVQMLDIYLLPVGLYFVTLGHLASHRQRRDQAHQFWWAGLLLVMTPAFLAYWHHAAAWHTLLLLAECLASVLWGIGQRIRAFTGAGLAFAALYGASVLSGRLPDVWGTLVSLLVGVGLFVIGFTIVTHRESARRWANTIEMQWQAWQAWR